MGGGELVPLVCGSMIAAYTVCDGIGVRAAGAALGYIVWLFVIDGIAFGAVVLWQRRARLRRELPAVLGPAVIGGTLSMLAYGIVIWAMSVAPLALVSAMRESSVVLAAVIGTRLMGEEWPADGSPRQSWSAAALPRSSLDKPGPGGIRRRCSSACAG